MENAKDLSTLSNAELEGALLSSPDDGADKRVCNAIADHDARGSLTNLLSHRLQFAREPLLRDLRDRMCSGPIMGSPQAVLHTIITSTTKLLTRRGALIEEEGSTYMAENDGDAEEARSLRPLQAAARTYRIAAGPRTGQKVLTVQGIMPRDTDFHQHLCAGIAVFGLHAAMRCGADDLQAMEQLCRYITHPALANDAYKPTLLARSC